MTQQVKSTFARGSSQLAISGGFMTLLAIFGPPVMNQIARSFPSTAAFFGDLQGTMQVVLGIGGAAASLGVPVARAVGSKDTWSPPWLPGSNSEDCNQIDPVEDVGKHLQVMTDMYNEINRHVTATEANSQLLAKKMDVLDGRTASTEKILTDVDTNARQAAEVTKRVETEYLVDETGFPIASVPRVTANDIDWGDREDF